ncbi:MAG: DNA polymerase III subunit beta [Patescibacteria group bacterium]|nr:DNA polymerase III subunit beta [Patescibacteria group bacterium]
MELISLKNNLKEGLNILGKINSENTILPILKNILIKTADNKIKISATNLELAITSYIPSKIIKDGQTTIPLNIFSIIINNLQNERINIEEKDNNIIIKTDNYQAKIQGIKKEEFPIIPKIENNKEYIEIKGETLKEIISSVINAAQISGSKPELGGILLDFQISLLKLAATDGFRLSEKTIDDNNFKTNIEKRFKTIIPLKTLQELTRIIPENEEEKIQIFFDSNQVMFKTDKYEVISRVINGDFPDYQAIIPNITNTEIVLNKEYLVNALKLTGSFSDKLNEIKITIKDGLKNIEIFSSNPVLGENQYLIPAKIKGEPIEIIFNWKFLFDGIKNISGENIVIGLNGDNKPAIIKPLNSGDHFYVLMPIKNN